MQNAETSFSGTLESGVEAAMHSFSTDSVEEQIHGYSRVSEHGEITCGCDLLIAVDLSDE